MATTKTRTELIEEIRFLRRENRDLQDRLSQIADLTSPEEESDEDEEE